MDFDDDEIDFEYTSDAEMEDAEDSAEIEIENTLCLADDHRVSDPKKALELYQRVVSLEEQRSGGEKRHTFEATKNIVIICGTLGNHEDLLKHYKALLGMAALTSRPKFTEGVNQVLNVAAASPASVTAAAAAASPQEEATRGIERQTAVYDLTLSTLKNSNHERLWRQCSSKLCRLQMERGDVAGARVRMRDIAASIEAELQQGGGTREGDNTSSTANQATAPTMGNTERIELNALEIQLCGLTGDRLRLREIYPSNAELSSVVFDQKTVATICRSGGEMYLQDGEWVSARNELLAAFRAFQQSGLSAEARRMLKYTALATLLAASPIDDLQSPEALAYQAEPEIRAVAKLRSAVEDNDLVKVQEVIAAPEAQLMSDALVAPLLGDLLRSIRKQVLTRLVRPYRRVQLSFLAQELCTGIPQLITVLIPLLEEKKIDGSIDDLEQTLKLRGRCGEGGGTRLELAAWAAQIAGVRKND
eukprot:GHVU01073155.1.p1 GENE.GHVU01073155.1~~GHVU01073155.1.p1  ORF type:complete len:477 (+),score=108.81 GHVU01073155.1:112-1542(+)